MPFSVTVADWNKDGKLDLLSPNQTDPGTVTIRLGNGDGTFAPTSSTITGAGGANPQYVIADDFNRDGNMDLAMTATGGTAIELFFGNGAGGVTLVGAIGTGTNYSTLTKGDFNRDGNIDVAAANLATNAVSVFLGNGSGGFSAPISLLGGGTTPRAITVGDFDNDNDLDVAVANNGSANISLYLNNGNAGFNTAVNVSAGTNPRALAAGDFNLDGKLDLAVANEGSGNVTVLRGDGIDNFSAATGSPFTTGAGAAGVATGDFNNDGKLDLAVANNGANNVSVLLGNGNQVGNQFAPAVNFTTANGPNGLALADFNYDGRLDLVTANLSANSNSVLLNACGGCGGLGLGNQTLLNVGAGPIAITKADFNNDAKPDLASANTTANTVSVLIGNGVGGFNAAINTAAGASPVALASGDFNRDGKADLAVANNTANTVSVLLGNGSGGFGAATSFATAARPKSVAVGDLNADGKLDLAVANQNASNVSVLLGNGLGSFGAATNFPAPSGCLAVAIGDFNRDGKPDLVTGNNAASSVAVLLGNGAGSFGAPLSASINDDPAALVIGDFNHDGKLDAATANDNANNVTVLLGNGNGGFGAPANYPAADGAGDLAIGDFNQDGKPDLVAGAFNTTVVTVLLNTGNGVFTKAADFTVGDAVYGVVTGDFNLDGNDDLATANNNDDNVSVRLGACCPIITSTPATLGNGTAGVLFNQLLSGSGGTGPYNFALISGALPGGLTLGTTGAITGTPTAVGTFNFEVRITDFNGCLGVQPYALTIVCPTITVNPAPVNGTLPAGTVSALYSQTFTQTGGVGVTNFSITAGALPAGLTLSAAGILSGTPTAPGTFNFTVTATDSNNCTGAQPYALTINCQTIALSPATLPTGTANTAYSQPITQTGGVGVTTFAVTTGALPAGVTLTSDGLLAGTPTMTGTFNFIITATDANGCTGAQTYTLTLNCQTLTVNPATVPSGANGSPYSQTFTQTNGIGTIAWTLTGTLPTGLSLNGSTGVLAGTPSQNGGFNFTVRATDGNGCFGERAYTLAIDCPTISLSPALLPSGNLGVAYNQTLTATGGTGALTWSVSAGTLPAGITLNDASGVLAGTPTMSGTFNFTARATTVNGCFGERVYMLSIGVCPNITIGPNTLPGGMVGASYNQTLTANGGTPPYNFSLNSGSVLPSGLTLATDGTLTGVPTSQGSFSFTIKVTDSAGCMTTKAYTFSICATITVNPASLPNSFVGTAYSQTLSATGGTAPYTFAATGNLPTGLTLNQTSGVLNGTPTTAGTFTFTITTTDSIGCLGTRTYTVIVSGNGLQFYPLTAPVRLLDTRPGASANACSQPNAPISGGTPRLQTGRNFCGIPANAQALTGNVTTVNSGGGFLTLYPSGATQPTVASTNYGVNEIINNVFTVGLGAADGAFNIFAFNTTDVVIDVTGYYAPPNTGGLYFHPLPTPVRLLETRPGQQIGCFLPGTPLASGTETLQQVTGVACAGIPATARAIVGNATTVNPQGSGFLTLFPADATRPLVASSNYNPGQIVNAPFTVGLSPAGQFKIFSFATTDLVVDVLGYYSTEASDANGAGLLLTPLARPIRLLETRANPPGLTGCFKPNAPLNGMQVYNQTARGVCDSLTIPPTALAVVGNATVVAPAGSGFLTLWPSGATQPTVATSNYNTNDVLNRHFIVGLGSADGAFKLYSFATTELVIDLSGYFAP